MSVSKIGPEVTWATYILAKSKTLLNSTYWNYTLPRYQLSTLQHSASTMVICITPYSWKFLSASKMTSSYYHSGSTIKNSILLQTLCCFLVCWPVILACAPICTVHGQFIKYLYQEQGQLVDHQVLTIQVTSAILTPHCFHSPVFYALNIVFNSPLYCSVFPEACGW